MAHSYSGLLVQRYARAIEKIKAQYGYLNFGKQRRIEHWTEHLRISRTGSMALRA